MNKKNTNAMMKASVGLTFLFFIILIPIRFVEAFSQEPAKNASLNSATISVTYIGDWDAEAQNAMEYAASIWEGAIYSPVPIEIEASWGSDFLGGPAYMFGAYVLSSQLPNPNFYYPEALSN